MDGLDKPKKILNSFENDYLTFKEVSDRLLQWKVRYDPKREITLPHIDKIYKGFEILRIIKTPKGYLWCNEKSMIFNNDTLKKVLLPA